MGMVMIEKVATGEDGGPGRAGCTMDEVASRLDSRVHIEASLTAFFAALFGAWMGSIGEFNGGNKAPPAGVVTVSFGLVKRTTIQWLVRTHLVCIEHGDLRSSR
jgi:hypothetical protein